MMLHNKAYQKEGEIFIMSSRPSTRAATRTGVMPRVEAFEAPLTLPEDEFKPHDLPEMPLPGATTGAIPAVPDPADPAKFADDSANGYPARS